MLSKERIIELKVYKHRRHKQNCKSGYPSPKFYYTIKLNHSYTQIINELRCCGYIEKNYIKKEIRVPANFDFKEDFSSCIMFFKQMISIFLLKECGNEK